MPADNVPDHRYHVDNDRAAPRATFRSDPTIAGRDEIERDARQDVTEVVVLGGLPARVPGHVLRPARRDAAQPLVTVVRLHQDRERH